MEGHNLSCQLRKRGKEGEELEREGLELFFKLVCKGEKRGKKGKERGMREEQNVSPRRRWGGLRGEGKERKRKIRGGRLVINPLPLSPSSSCSFLSSPLFLSPPPSHKKQTTKIDGQLYLVKIWDTCCEEGAGSFLPVVFRTSDIVLVTYQSVCTLFFVDVFCTNCFVV